MTANVQASRRAGRFTWWSPGRNFADNPGSLHKKELKSRSVSGRIQDYLLVTHPNNSLPLQHQPKKMLSWNTSPSPPRPSAWSRRRSTICLQKLPGVFYFTEEIMKNEREDRPVASKPDKKKRRRCIRILVQKFDKGQQRTYQNNFDRRQNGG